MIYDDDYLTLGVGWLLVDQSDGTFPPFAIVRGSKRYPRDPRPEPTEWQQLQRAIRYTEWRPVPLGMKYCSDCGEWRALDKFSPDKRNRDGKQSYCKACQAERMRRYRTYRAAS